jgi:hypothetical protein
MGKPVRRRVLRGQGGVGGGGTVIVVRRRGPKNGQNSPLQISDGRDRGKKQCWLCTHTLGHAVARRVLIWNPFWLIWGPFSVVSVSGPCRGDLLVLPYPKSSKNTKITTAGEQRWRKPVWLKGQTARDVCCF